MILAVDVGNTNIVFGGFDNNGELRFISRLKHTGFKNGRSVCDKAEGYIIPLRL